MPRKVKLPHITVYADLHRQAKQVADREDKTLTEIASRGLVLALREIKRKESPKTA